MPTKKLKKTTLILPLLLAGLLVGCSSSDSDHDPQTGPAATADIVDTAIAAGDFNILVTALQAAELDTALRGPGPFTVFAPTDTAFSAIPATVLNDLISNPNKAALRDILKYHVFDGEVRASDAIALAGQSVPMLNGDLLAIDTAGSDLVLNNSGTTPAVVVTTDILTTNGVIHVIDAVLAPADGKSHIVDKLDNLGDFTTLLTAVDTAGLTGTLSGPGPFTLFAPTDTAFGAIPPADLAALLSSIPALTDVLTYHVIADEIFAVDALAASGASVTMLNGGDVNIDLDGSNLVLNQGGGSPAIVIETDFLSTNGIVHVIDAVLDPGDAP